MTRLPQLLATIAGFAALALPASALASVEGVIRDCAQDGTLDGHYSDRDLRQARGQLPTDVNEYSDCREIINAAIASGSGTSGASASSTEDTPSAKEKAARAGDQQALEQAGREQPGEIAVGGRRVAPGSNGLFDVATASNGLPLPLLLALIGLALLSLAGGFLALRSRIPVLARISLPSRGRLRRPRR